MRIIKATYGPSESGSTGTVIGGTIVAAPSSTPRGSSASPQPPGPSATRGELDQWTTQPPATRIGSGADGDFDLRAIPVPTPPR